MADQPTNNESADSDRFDAQEDTEVRPATQEEIDAVQKSLQAAVTRSEE